MMKAISEELYMYSLSMISIDTRQPISNLT